MYAYRFSMSTRLRFSARNLSVSPYARIVASPESDSEKWLYKDDRNNASAPRPVCVNTLS